MPCPNCGGNSREVIAPGFWLCTSPIPVGTPGPGLLGLPGPPVAHIMTPCGKEYQEVDADMGPTPLCSCGTYSIGQCMTCRRPVCGSRTCSTVRTGRRVCTACHAEEVRVESTRLAVEREEVRGAEERSHKTAVDRQRALYGPEAPIRQRIQELSKHRSPRFRTFGSTVATVSVAGQIITWIAFAEVYLHGSSQPPQGAAMTWLIASLVISGAIVLLLYLRDAAMRRQYSSAQREIAILRGQLGCGRRGCNRCGSY